MADKIVVMNHGVVEQFGTPQEIYDHPATLFVADFIGSPVMNLVAEEGTPTASWPPATEDSDYAVPAAWKPALAAPCSGDDVVSGFRPEAAQVSPTGAISGTVYTVRPARGVHHAACQPGGRGRVGT